MERALSLPKVVLGRAVLSGAIPALQRMAPNRFDCKHSSFAPGAFDVERAAFLSVRERRPAAAGEI